MGDRGNIVVHQSDGGDVYLYTHWTGHEIPTVVSRALASEAGRGRWADPAYLTRIIFDVLTEGEHGNETGYGISTSLCDNQHPIVVVDPTRQLVRFADEGAERGGVTHGGMSFAEYIATYTQEVRS